MRPPVLMFAGAKHLPNVFKALVAPAGDAAAAAAAAGGSERIQ